MSAKRTIYHEAVLTCPSSIFNPGVNVSPQPRAFSEGNFKANWKQFTHTPLHLQTMDVFKPSVPIHRQKTCRLSLCDGVLCRVLRGLCISLWQCLCLWVYVCMSVCLCACMFLYGFYGRMFVCLHVCQLLMRSHVCMFVCLCIFISIYSLVHREVC